MTISSIELYDLLKIKIGETEAKSVITFVEQRTEEKWQEKKDVLATKEDIAELKGEFKSAMSEIKSEMLKWMFIYWTGAMATILGIVKFFMIK